MREEVILELRMQVRRVSQLLARPSHLLISSGKAEARGFAARKCRCAESDYRRRFQVILDLHSHFPRSKFKFENRASFFMLSRALPSLASSRDSGTVRTPLTCVTVDAFRFSGLIAFPRF